MEGPSEHRALCSWAGHAPVKPAPSSSQPHKWSVSLAFTAEPAKNPETEKNLPKVPRAVVELEFKQSLFLTRLSVWLVWRNEITTR